MEKFYKCTQDLQGCDFAVGRICTVESWRESAIMWAETDCNDELAEYFKNKVDPERIIEEIADFWQLDFEEMEAGVVEVNKKYDEVYEEIWQSLTALSAEMKEKKADNPTWADVGSLNHIQEKLAELVDEVRIV